MEVYYFLGVRVAMFPTNWPGFGTGAGKKNSFPNVKKFINAGMTFCSDNLIQFKQK